MKTTGLRAKDLRAMAKAQPKAKNRNRNRSSSSQATNSVNSNPQLAAQAATFMGLPITAGVPMGMLGAAAGAMSMLPPHFTQVSRRLTIMYIYIIYIYIYIICYI